jgi:hypothetical protein
LKDAELAVPVEKFRAGVMFAPMTRPTSFFSCAFPLAETSPSNALTSPAIQKTLLFTLKSPGAIQRRDGIGIQA